MPTIGCSLRPTTCRYTIAFARCEGIQYSRGSCLNRDVGQKNNMRFIAIALMLMIAGCATPPIPPDNRVGIVPNEQTAVRIAEAVLIPIYGSQHMKAERPYKATLENGVWEVRGTLQPLSAKILPSIFTMKGGTAVVRIRQSDGQIIETFHEK